MAGEDQDESAAGAPPLSPEEAAIPDDGEGAPVDIHKPKPVHSWREFLTEISTIICGILIALALEQVVETAHRQHEMAEAREALHREMSDNLRIVAFATEETKCIVTQADDHARWARGGAKPGLLRSNLVMALSNVWDSVKASAVPNMPLKERLEFSKFYDGVLNFNSIVQQQRMATLVLIGAHEYESLDRTDAHRLLDAVAQERAMAQFKQGNGEALIIRAGRLGVTPPPLDPDDRANLAEICGSRGDAAPAATGSPEASDQSRRS